LTGDATEPDAKVQLRDDVKVELVQSMGSDAMICRDAWAEADRWLGLLQAHEVAQALLNPIVFDCDLETARLVPRLDGRMLWRRRVISDLHAAVRTSGQEPGGPRQSPARAKSRLR
jgi:hypothetical protein